MKTINQDLEDMKWRPIKEDDQNQTNENKQLMLEMARLGFVEANPRLEIYVHTDDPGKNAHFHIRDAATRGQEFHTCIMFQSANYFHHNGKEDVLNAKERKLIVDFFQSPYKRDNSKTNWEHAIEIWDDNNSDIDLPLDMPMPDYTQLPN